MAGPCLICGCGCGVAKFTNRVGKTGIYPFTGGRYPVGASYATYGRPDFNIPMLFLTQAPEATFVSLNEIAVQSLASNGGSSTPFYYLGVDAVPGGYGFGWNLAALIVTHWFNDAHTAANFPANGVFDLQGHLEGDPDGPTGPESDFTLGCWINFFLYTLYFPNPPAANGENTVFVSQRLKLVNDGTTLGYEADLDLGFETCHVRVERVPCPWDAPCFCNGFHQFAYENFPCSTGFQDLFYNVIYSAFKVEINIVCRDDGGDFLGQLGINDTLTWDGSKLAWVLAGYALQGDPATAGIVWQVSATISCAGVLTVKFYSDGSGVPPNTMTVGELLCTITKDLAADETGSGDAACYDFTISGGCSIASCDVSGTITGGPSTGQTYCWSGAPFLVVGGPNPGRYVIYPVILTQVASTTIWTGTGFYAPFGTVIPPESLPNVAVTLDTSTWQLSCVLSQPGYSGIEMMVSAPVTVLTPPPCLSEYAQQNFTGGSFTQFEGASITIPDGRSTPLTPPNVSRVCYQCQ